MSNFYPAQVQQLEGVLASKRKQVALLEEEHRLLQQKESYLQNAIQGIEVPLALVKASLSGILAADQHTDLATTPAQHPAASHTAVPCSSSDPRSHALLDCSSCTSSGVAADTLSGGCCDNGSRSSSLTAASSRAGAAQLLQQTDALEGQVQLALQHLGASTSTDGRQLYTTLLLQRAVADPARTAEYMSHDTKRRLQFWNETHRQMALLLGKYDSNVRLASGSVRQQLDALVDLLFERVVVCALLSPPKQHMSCLNFNVETHELEEIPQGWWRQVMEGMQLSPEQKATLKLAWERFRSSSQSLTQELEQLQTLLQTLHTRQLQSNQEFEQAVSQLPALMRSLDIAQRSRLQEQQQQQKQEPEQAMPGQQHRLVSRPQQQQQQQQCNNQQALLQFTPQQQQERGSLEQQVQHQQQALLLQQLHHDWQRADGAPELANGHLLEQQMQVLLQQQQQRSGLWPGTANGGAPLPAADSMHAEYACGLSQLLYKQQQQQQQQQQAVPVTPVLAPAPSPAAAAAAAAVPSATPSCQPLAGTGSPADATAALPDTALNGSLGGCVVDGSFSRLQAAEEVLLQDGGRDRQLLERRMQSTTNKLKVQYFCLTIQVANCLSKKQLAAMCVHSHPFVWDAASVCQVLSEAEP